MHARPLFYLLAGDVEQMSAHRQHTEIDTCHFLFTFSLFGSTTLYRCGFSLVLRDAVVRDIRDAPVKRRSIFLSAKCSSSCQPALSSLLLTLD